MNIFQYASACEQMFENFLNDVGKEHNTTFFGDLSIAEWFGTNAINDTYERVMKEWGNNLEFMCEWVVALNQKIWQHYDKGNKELARLYDSLWRKADAYCQQHFKGKELSEYYRYID